MTPDAHLIECAAERRGCRMSCVDSDLFNWLFGVDPAIDGRYAKPLMAQAAKLRALAETYPERKYGAE